MLLSFRSTVLSLVVLALGLRLAAGGGGGYDTPTGANLTLDMLGPDREQAPQPGRTWLRLRGVSFLPVPLAEDADPAAREARAAEIAAARADLLALRAAGYRLAGMLRWDTRHWSVVRSGPMPTGNQAPLDLRVAYERAYALGLTYGDTMDFWEFDNEPEIFYAETADVFAAFHKAMAWGFWRANSEAGRVGGQTGRVLMAAPALPPGPHFAQLQANGHLAYTEGFNYHYYGFAQDYEGVHQRFIDAVGAKSVGVGAWWDQVRGEPGEARRWPVLVSEWGYSLLDGYDAQTVAGRVAQWRFFKDVAEQQERLRIEGPMAFLLRPYYEHGMREYGLGMPTAERRAAHYGFVVEAGEGVGGADANRSSRQDAKTQRSADEQASTSDSAPSMAARLGATLGVGGNGGREFRAGGLTFRPEDFAAGGGRGRAERWMERIGEPAGEGIEASPALAWLRADAAERERRAAAERRLQAAAGVAGKAGRGLRAASERVARSGDWVVRTEAPSPVVLDLVPGEGTRMVKSYHGYWVSRLAGPDRREGAVELAWYNFGAEPAEVSWTWPEGLSPVDGSVEAGGRLRLEPGERRVVPARLGAPWGRMQGQEVAVAAAVEAGGRATVSRWASRVYADPAGYRPVQAVDLAKFTAEDAAANRERVLGRPLAEAEPPVEERADSRWLATAGARVEDVEDGINILIEALPGVGTRPVVVELPLPEGPAFAPGLMLSYAYRLRPAWPGERVEELRSEDPEPTRRRLIGRLGLVMESYFRTSEGHLYSTQPRLTALEEWKTYFQPWESFTPHFLGRTTPTRELEERRPAALVFFIRPTRLPAVIEIRSLSLAEWGAAPR